MRHLSPPAPRVGEEGRRAVLARQIHHRGLGGHGASRHTGEADRAGGATHGRLVRRLHVNLADTGGRSYGVTLMLNDVDGLAPLSPAMYTEMVPGVVYGQFTE